MITRTTLTMASRQTLYNLENVRLRRDRATNEISTGRRVRRASDGPMEAAGIVRTESDLRSLAQFRSTLQGVGDQLRAADTALSHAVDLLTRASTLASQAANFNQTAATRTGIAVEVQSLIQNLIAVANTSLGGKFLFAGGSEERQPFLPDAANPNGVVYRGDTGRRAVAFPGATESVVTLDGRSIFLRPDSFLGSGRTAGSTGASTPNPPVGIGITFSGGLNASIFADLPSFLAAAAPPSVPGAGDQVTVNFTAADGSLSAALTATLAGGETAAQIAAALNAEVAASGALAGNVTFSEEGGRLKIIESDTVGVGLTFTASATGGLVTGLESGGLLGGLSALEIAAALNAGVAADPALASASVRFAAVNGEVEVDGDVGFTLTAIDFDRGTGFVSGLAGRHEVGGDSSANIFQTLRELHTALLANDAEGIRDTLESLRRTADHVSSAQGFYGAAQRQVLSAVDSLNQLELVHQEKLSSLRDADLVRAISDLTQAQINEEAALRAAARQPGRSLFDVLV
jgi:flagellin-like hook-associated protein FlgL